MLRIVEPYIAYGYPNLKTVRELIYKRGYGRIDKQRIPVRAVDKQWETHRLIFVQLTDNELIERALGQYGIICMEVRPFLLSTYFSRADAILGFDSRNLYCWPQFQTGFKLSVALQVEQSDRWLPSTQIQAFH